MNAPHSADPESLFRLLNSTPQGLTAAEARTRISQVGRNELPIQAPPSLLLIFFRQYLNPLIYILGLAAAVSLALGDLPDAAFILLVVVLNSITGTIQEYGAEQSARALREMSTTTCLVLRDAIQIEVSATELVPGDVVDLDSGRKVPADLRLLSSQSLEIDESLLTGESMAVEKNSGPAIEVNAPLADRTNMAFKGTLVTKGRARGLVVHTGKQTELGKIATSLSSERGSKPPLIIRMEAFTKRIAIALVAITLVIAAFLLLRGQSWYEVLMVSVALAVSAIPEGLPVALTVALAIASRRMARQNVIVRRLPAVEALGSCSYIVTDKTGTLTVNQLTVKKIFFPHKVEISVEGSGFNPDGALGGFEELSAAGKANLVTPLLQAGVLCNEAQMRQVDGHWHRHGDAVDLSLLVLSYKFGVHPDQLRSKFRTVDSIPFEAENQFAANLHETTNGQLLTVKGAIEKILPLCDTMITAEGEASVTRDSILQQADDLADQGYRVIALAQKTQLPSYLPLQEQLHHLTFVGLVGMIDPLRPEAAEAVRSCREAGIEVAMVTGDHPRTAWSIARELGMAQSLDQVVTGSQLKKPDSATDKARLIDQARVFARVEPQQKLEIVRHLLDRGKFVAVTGDGANDAPALRAANVGVAMGQGGTDVAKETADLIITDDRFASVVAGIVEGRVAYNNVRKVVYLLTATGAAEILLFALAIIFNTPLPLTAAQTLWLNLVTNGIQDVGLAFEPGEGSELNSPPRKPNESIFDRLMLERIILSALVMGLVSYFYFFSLINMGVGESSARNLTLLLMVLFENIMIGNCRSETRSAFLVSPFKNPILLFGTLAAQAIHIGALYHPTLQKLLGVEPVSLVTWIKLLALGFSVFVVMEVYKWSRRNKINYSSR